MIKKLNIRLLLLSLIPLGYILKGPLTINLTILFYIGIVFIGAYDLVVKKKYFSLSKLDFLFCAWFFILMLGVFYSPMQKEGILKVAEFAIVGGTLVFLPRIFIRNSKDMETFFNYLLVLSILTSYLVLSDYFLYAEPKVRYLAFGDVIPIPLSLLGATTSLILLIMFFYKKINLLIFIFGLIPSLSMMVIAASKGPIVAFIVSLLAMLPSFIKKIKIKHGLFMLLGVIILFILDSITKSFDYLVSRFSNIGESESTDIRFNIFNNAADIFYSHPFLGIGTGGLSSYPHNILLELASENGISLVLIFLILLLIVFQQYIKYVFRENNKFLKGIIIALLVCSLITLMFSFTYIKHKYFFLSIGLLNAYYFKIDQKEN